MKSYNPYLPLDEYVPDGEPHVFGDRLYIFGSHDIFGTKEYCSDNYVCWSCPVDDLGAWTYDGEIYNINRHPNLEKKENLYAPDVVQGNDGMYYLYYSIANSSIISVAKSFSPNGQYDYYGDVRFKNGRVAGTSKEDWFQFDPAVLNDEGRIWLYSGSGQKHNKKYGHPVVGAFVMELESDMLTMKQDPEIIMPYKPSLRKPNFFEASSIRKFGELYYFVYAASNHSGLHYCTSKFPNKNFQYRGRIHSSSDLGLNGTKIWNPKYPVGNSHGSIEKVLDTYYIFDHRMTNSTPYERQGVAEKIEVLPDGSIKQVEATSQGLNGEPLDTFEVYPAPIAANLYSKKLLGKVPFITRKGEETYVTNIGNKSVLGYKYFFLNNNSQMNLKIRGAGSGKLIMSFNEKFSHIEAEMEILATNDWTDYSLRFGQVKSIEPIFLQFIGKGTIEFLEFSF